MSPKTWSANAWLWHAIIAQSCVAGDAVVLERWTEDRFKLRMHIIKDASEEFIAAATAAKPKAKRSTARTAQRGKPARSPSKRVSRSASGAATAFQTCSSPEAAALAKAYASSSKQGYSPGRGDSSALDALHAAALLCADPASLPPEAEIQAPAISKSAPMSDAVGHHSRIGVSAAAVAAADAAALKLDGSNLLLAAGLSANQRSPAQLRTA